MDKHLFEALKKVMAERGELTGSTLAPEHANALVLKLSDQVSRAINDRLETTLSSCGSFQCPSSYSCDWF